jgi:AcrR family transcriptional regulator
MTLMRATLDLAEAHGFSGLGLREISRESGIAPTSFYRHFADVEELGLGIIERLVGPVLAPIARAAEAAIAEGHDPIEVIVDGLLEAAVDDPGLLRFVLAQHTGAHPSFRRALHDQFETLIVALRPSLPAGAPELAPAVILSGILLGCNRLLEGAPDERRALCTQLKPPMVQATRWLVHRPAAENK